MLVPLILAALPPGFDVRPKAAHRAPLFRLVVPRVATDGEPFGLTVMNTDGSVAKGVVVDVAGKEYTSDDSGRVTGIVTPDKDSPLSSVAIGGAVLATMAVLPRLGGHGKNPNIQSVGPCPPGQKLTVRGDFLGSNPQAKLTDPSTGATLADMRPQAWSAVEATYQTPRLPAGQKYDVQVTTGDGKASGKVGGEISQLRTKLPPALPRGGTGWLEIEATAAEGAWAQVENRNPGVAIVGGALTTFHKLERGRARVKVTGKAPGAYEVIVRLTDAPRPSVEDSKQSCFAQIKDFKVRPNGAPGRTQVTANVLTMGEKNRPLSNTLVQGYILTSDGAKFVSATSDRRGMAKLQADFPATYKPEDVRCQVSEVENPKASHMRQHNRNLLYAAIIAGAPMFMQHFGQDQTLSPPGTVRLSSGSATLKLPDSLGGATAAIEFSGQYRREWDASGKAFKVRDMGLEAPSIQLKLTRNGQTSTVPTGDVKMSLWEGPIPAQFAADYLNPNAGTYDAKSGTLHEVLALSCSVPGLMLLGDGPALILIKKQDQYNPATSFSRVYTGAGVVATGTCTGTTVALKAGHKGQPKACTFERLCKSESGRCSNDGFGICKNGQCCQPAGCAFHFGAKCGCGLTGCSCAGRWSCNCGG